MGRLDQGMMDLMLPVIQAKPNTTQARLHLGYLPAKVGSAAAKEHQEQEGLLGAWESSRGAAINKSTRCVPDCGRRQQGSVQCSGARGQGCQQQGGRTASARECTKSLLESKPCNICIVSESPHPPDGHTGASHVRRECVRERGNCVD